MAVAHTNAPDIGATIAKKIKGEFRLEKVFTVNAALELGANAGSRA
jgi:hypothetical protein